MKVTSVPEWDEYFLAIAQVVKLKSKDPRCPVDAVIVSPDNLVLATGYNGLARCVADDETLLEHVPEKLRWICHAEENAILNAARTGASTRGSTIYVTKFPCFNCCNAIVQAGITRIYTHDHKYWDDDFIDGKTVLQERKVSQPHTRKPALLRQGRVRVDVPFHPDFGAGWRFTLNGIANGNDGPQRSGEASDVEVENLDLFGEPSSNRNGTRKGLSKVPHRRTATRHRQRRRSGS
jgi:dCMP deaminase